MTEHVWDKFLTERDKAVFAAGGFGATADLGKRPALLVIDVSWAFCGDRPEPILESIKRWRASCGEESWVAVEHIKTLTDKARGRGIPVILEPAQQLLRDDALYVYHSKCSMKEAIKGEIWQWHQDYGAWRNDGVPTANMTTALLMLDEATEIGGCLYFIPGSHTLGRFDAELDSETTSYRLWAVKKLDVMGAMERFGDPVAITGKAGTVVLFHPNLVHGSGHNMSRYSRWHIYTVYNPVANRPPLRENARPEWVVARDVTPLQLGSDEGIAGVRRAGGGVGIQLPRVSNLGSGRSVTLDRSASGHYFGH